MSTPLGTPVRQAKLAISSSKSPLAAEYKRLLAEQHQRLWAKHQQDLDLIDDIRSYVKARLSIERDYATALNKLGKQHAGLIAKKFQLMNQCDPPQPSAGGQKSGAGEQQRQSELNSDSRLQKRLASNGADEPERPASLYKVWSEHVNRLQSSSRNRSEQFEQLIMIVDKLKDIRSHKAAVGRKCLDTHLKRIHEDVLVSVVEIEKARKLYHEDESQAKKARENEERIKKKRSGLLTKFTDLQAKKEKTSAQREANDIQSTQARNDYIMALAAGNAHLQHYYQRDLADFIQLIDDGVLDHCKIFMATLSECDINSLKDALAHAQYWSKMINLTGSQKTNAIFLECDQSACLRTSAELAFEACNSDPVRCISLEHNADYALQHEVDKWFTWFKKECRNLSQLVHALDACQHAFAEGKRSIELNGQTVEDLEPKIIELKQQIRKSEAAKLKAQARLKVIKDGGMQIEEWSSVELEIRADMARAQEELEARRLKESSSAPVERSADDADHHQPDKPAQGYMLDGSEQVHLQVSKESDYSDAGDSVNRLATVSRSNSNLAQKQQNAISGYSALADPSLVWQDDYSSAWGSAHQNIVVTDSLAADLSKSSSNAKMDASQSTIVGAERSLDMLAAGQQGQKMPTSMTVQSSSPLSAIVNGGQSSPSPYPGMVSEAYKSDYECDYNRNSGQHARSAASSVEPFNQQHQAGAVDPFGAPVSLAAEGERLPEEEKLDERSEETVDAYEMLNRDVVALYSFDKTNEDDLAFNESDVLRVLEVSDANWVKARNDATGEEGFVPTSYIRICDRTASEGTEWAGQRDELDNNRRRDEYKGQPADSTYVTDSIDTDPQQAPQQQTGTWSVGSASQLRDLDLTQADGPSLCRAVYDYEPEANTFEEDGLPHLALVQGELMRVIDQGEDDGWWLVEKEDTGARGHVPSMLVELVDPDEGDENEDDGDNEEVSEFSEGDADQPVAAMPSFEPPILGAPPTHDAAEGGLQTRVEIDASASEAHTETIARPAPVSTNSTSLVATSFIIIEPTPEVESRSFEEFITSGRRGGEAANREEQSTEQPTSYSVVNESFTLDRPLRRPDAQQSGEQNENNSLHEDSSSQRDQANDISSKTPDGNYEPLSEVDSVDMQAPPSVVIESFYDENNNNNNDQNNSFDDLEEGRNSSASEIESYHYVPQREIKHTGNVDVSPILRLRAEEFSKQIIAEAIMMAPGSGVGPSTSSVAEPTVSPPSTPPSLPSPDGIQ